MTAIAETAAGEQLAGLLDDADKPHPPAPDEPIRFSRLRKMAKSPMHFAYAREDEASHLDIGSAAHSMILGGVRVIAYPGKVRAGKEWEKFKGENGDALILTRRELSSATGMADALRKDKEAMRVLDGEREKTILWKNQGRLCRGTPDVRGQSGGEHFVTELKTGETSDPRSFVWKVIRFAYHAQLGWYSDGAVLSGLDEPSAHYIVAVEAKPPHVVTVFRLTPKSIEQGRRLVRVWFEQLLNCERTNEWPPYVQSVVDLELPEENLEILEAAMPAMSESEAPF